MTKTHAIATLTIFSMLFTPLAWSAPAGQVQNASGDVRIVTRTATPKFARSGDAVEPGTSVLTGERSHVVLRFTDGQVVALASNSTFRLDNYAFEQAAPEKGAFAASFLRGAARFVTGLIGDRNRAGWRVDTPTATAGIRGTDVLLGLRQGLYAHVKAGAVGLTNSGGTLVVEAGQSGHVASAAAIGVGVDAGALPAGLFGELEGVSLSGLGGSASGAGGGLSLGGIGLPTAAAIGLGIAAAVAAASGGGQTTVQH